MEQPDFWFLGEGEMPLGDWTLLINEPIEDEEGGVALKITKKYKAGSKIAGHLDNWLKNIKRTIDSIQDGRHIFLKFPARIQHVKPHGLPSTDSLSNLNVKLVIHIDLPNENKTGMYVRDLFKPYSAPMMRIRPGGRAPFPIMREQLEWVYINIPRKARKPGVFSWQENNMIHEWLKDSKQHLHDVIILPTDPKTGESILDSAKFSVFHFPQTGRDFPIYGTDYELEDNVIMQFKIIEKEYPYRLETRICTECKKISTLMCDKCKVPLCSDSCSKSFHKK